MGSPFQKNLVNPFIFPSELSFYFILMIILLSAPTFTFTLSAIRALIDPSFQLPPAWHSFIWLHLLIQILLPVLTVLFYKKGVENIIKKYGKNDVKKDYPEFWKLVCTLSEDIGIKSPISFYIPGKLLYASVFGYRKQAYMLVSTDLCENFNIFPNVIKTIVIHELSHLKNNDVVQHEIAEAFWKSFLVVTLVGILCTFLLSYPPPFGWLLVIALAYVIPFCTVFYLNNVIQRWREIYADWRAIIFQKSDRDVLLALRLLPLHSLAGWKRILSPFILTALKRIKIIKEGFIKRIIERGLICSALNTISLGSIMISLSFLWDIEDHWFPLFTVIAWNFISYYLIFVVALPYWGSLWKKRVETMKELVMRTFIIPLKLMPTFLLSFLLFFLSTLASGSLLSLFDVLFSFLIITYLLLILYQLLFSFMLSLVSLKIKPIVKFNIPPLTMFTFFSPLFLAFYFQLPESLLFIGICIGLSLILLIFMIFNKKYSKCPSCGVKPMYKKHYKISNKRLTFEFRDYLECPYCSKRFNEEIFIPINYEGYSPQSLGRGKMFSTM